MPKLVMDLNLLKADHLLPFRGLDMPSEILKRLPGAQLEVEFNALVHMVVRNRERLNDILNRYGVAKPEDIKAKIANGELKAHPAFEDYLSALAYQIDTEDMLKKLEEKMKELREST